MAGVQSSPRKNKPITQYLIEKPRVYTLAVYVHNRIADWFVSIYFKLTFIDNTQKLYIIDKKVSLLNIFFKVCFLIHCDRFTYTYKF